ncbi:hypothetical protein EPI10_021528 [Gossypium australe]|uniref:Uncharacterized protein n=1 Tax=Gossypium australe TaxID=47621 RepID=A0A5B6WIZ3_9ROSI|nr:hypothetical protein EPI10_021528 [Gossypium australe]
MTRLALGNLLFDSKIETTVRANHKETKLQKKQLEVVGTKKNPPPEIEPGFDPPEKVPNTRVNVNPNPTQEPMAQKIRQMAEAFADQQLLCTAYPTMDTNFEVKSRFIQLLLTFCELQNENHTNI